MSLASSAVEQTVYLRRDAIVEDVKGKITAAVTETVTNAIPGMLDSAMPELPSEQDQQYLVLVFDYDQHTKETINV